MAQLEKIMSIYYGSNKLPYKDEDRQINYPVMGGNLFIGENNVTTIRFFVDRIGGNEFTWLAVVKLPDGSKVYRQLPQVSQDGYVDFDISSIYTTQQGAIFIALQGYTANDTNVSIDDNVYVINGDPDILVTGVVKIMVNYAPEILNMGTDISYSQYQQILALLSKKLGLNQAQVFYQDITNISSSEIATSELANGQIVWDENTNWFYSWNSTDETFEIVTLDGGANFIGALPTTNVSLNDTLANLVSKGFVERAFMISGSPYIYCIHNRAHSGTPNYEVYRQILGDYKVYKYQTSDTSLTLNAIFNGGLATTYNFEIISRKVSAITGENKASETYYPNNKATTDYVDDNAISSFVFNTTTYALAFYNGKGQQVGNTIDLPIESVVVNGTYDSTNKQIILTLQNGNTITISVSDLVSGLIPTSDIVDNLNTNNSTKVLSAKQGKLLNDYKLDKSTTPSILYGTNASSQQTTFGISSSNTGGTVARRDSDGHLSASNPTSANHCATKNYVDTNCEKVANKVTSLSSSSTDTQFPSAKCVFDNLKEIRNIASGCTTSYLTSVSITESDILDAIADEVVYYIGNNGELVMFSSTSNFNTWKDNKTINQDIFASTNEQLAFTNFLSGHYCVVCKDDKLICVELATYDLLFKDGDLLYVDGNYLDRWYFSNTLQINNGGSPIINDSVVSGTTPSFNANSLVTYKCSSALTSLTISGLTQGQNDNNPTWQIQFVANSGFIVVLPNNCTWKYGTPTFNVGEEYTIIIEKRINNDYYAYLL